MTDLYNNIVNPHSAIVEISKWAKRKKLAGVMWTALPPVDRSGASKTMTSIEALNYLSSLQGTKREQARDYLRKTPPQINTEIRKLAREKLGWTDFPLSSELFEG